MYRFILQNLRSQMTRWLIWITTDIVVLILILIIYGCTSHENPFDPKNEQTKGRPFNLSESAGFGEIKLTWKHPMLDGKPMPIDFYRIYKKGTKGVWSLLADISKDSSCFTDSSVVSDIQYYYKLQAVRGNDASDFSQIGPVSTYWFPDSLEEIELTTTEPIAIAFSPSYRQDRYIADSWNNTVYILNSDDKYIDKCEVGKKPEALIVWNEENIDYIFVCNWGDRTVSLHRRELNYGMCSELSKINIGSRPEAVVAISIDTIFVAATDDSLHKIIVVDQDFLVKDTAIAITPDDHSLLYLPDSNKIIVISDNANEIFLIESKSLTIEPMTVDGLNKAADCAISSDGKWLYIANYGGPEHVLIIDIGSRTLVGSIILPEIYEQYKAISVAFVPVPECPLGDLLFILGINNSGVASIFSYIIRVQNNIPEATFLKIKEIDNNDVIKAYQIRYTLSDDERRLYILLHNHIQSSGAFKLIEPIN